MNTRSPRMAALAVVLTTMVCVTAQIAAAANSNIRVIATGLNNPRGVAVASDGAIFVAQAGAAGRKCAGKGENATCLGFTGSIDRIAGGKRERYGAGFASGGSRDGSFAVGVDGVTVSPSGQVYGIETTNGPNPARFGAAFAAQAGHVLRVDHGMKTAIGASVSAYEYKHNPARDNLDSDPYGIAWSPLGFAVADAAGNDLLLVNPSGRVTTLATFPAQRFGARAAQSVPTSVAWHDAAFYVGELGGDGTPVGKSRIWKVVPGEPAEVYATGFTAISGLAFGPDGSMWVDELGVGGLAALGQGKLTGALIRVATDGRRTQVAKGQLTAPAGVAVGADGTVYVANKSVFAGKGELVAITP